MRVVVIADKTLPTDHSFVDGCLVRALPKRGIEVILAGFALEPKVAASAYAGSGVKLHLLGKAGKNTVATDLRTTLWLARMVLRSGPPTVFFVRNRNIPSIGVGLLCKVRRGRFLIHQVSNYHGELLLATETGFLRRLAARVDIALRRIATRLSSICYAISESMADDLRRSLSGPGRVRAVPLGIADDRFTRFVPWSERTTDALYIGTFSRSRRLEMTLAVIDHARMQVPLRVRFFGGSHDADDDIALRELVRAMDLEDVVEIHAPVPQKMIDAALQDAKVGLALIPPTPFFMLSSPTKTVEYIAAGCRALAAEGIPDQDEVVRSTDGGTLCQWDVEGAADSLVEILANATHEEDRARNAQQAIVSLRSYDSLADTIAEDVRRLVAPTTLKGT